jgi:hypothetical protein
MIDRETFSKFIFGLSKVYPKFAPDFRDEFVFEFWFSAFTDYKIDDLKNIIPVLRDTCEDFPSIKKLKSLLQNGGLIDDQDFAEDCAARIECAIASHGSYNHVAAKEYIGELGWEVVKQLGGWNRICEVRTDELASARRLWRELAKTVQKKSRSNILNQAPRLPISDKTVRVIKNIPTLALQKRKDQK